MITRIELDGFKTFSNFSLDLAPLTVIVGANGVGKSNLFAAILLLSRLAETDIHTAFQDIQAEFGELFTILPNGQTVDRMYLAVEVLLDRRIRDDWGNDIDLIHTRLRYELVIQPYTNKKNLESILISKETMESIDTKNDEWLEKHFKTNRSGWIPKKRSKRTFPFISTEQESIILHPDASNSKMRILTRNIEKTVLSSINQTEFPHILALRKEILSWKILRLNTHLLRRESPIRGQSHLTAEGENLPAALARIESEDPFLINDISRDLSNIVNVISKITVQVRRDISKYVILAKTTDGRLIPSQLLSDGTMRMLALVTLKHDPDHRGVLCFEEPENGIHPAMLKRMGKLLQELSTNFNDEVQSNWPLQQLIVNTHSPILISQPALRHNLFYANTPTLVSQDKPAMQVTRITPIEMIVQRDFTKKEQAYTLDQVIKYLSTVDEAVEVREQIEGKSDKSAA